MYKHQYIKYKTKYVNLKMNQGGGGKVQFVVLHNPNPMHTREDNTNREILTELRKLGKIYHYYFKFGSSETDFVMEDLSFENVALDINNQFKKKIFVICF